MLDLLAIDREDAILLMEYMARWFKKGSGSRVMSEFKSFDDFVPFRYEDAAAPYVCVEVTKKPPCVMANLPSQVLFGILPLRHGRQGIGRAKASRGSYHTASHDSNGSGK